MFVTAACLVVLVALFAGSLLVVRAPVVPDAIISLASHEWERLPETARQARAFPDARVILTVPQAPTVDNCHDCAQRGARLAALGVAPSRVDTITLTGPGTHGEAVDALDFVRHAGIRRLLIVTSPYHTRRSLATFRHVFAGSGIEVGVEPAWITSHARPNAWWWQPDDRAYVPYEWAAIVYYAWTYGVPIAN